MKLTNFSSSPEAKSFPIEIASDLNIFEHFPQDFSPQVPPTNFPSPQFNHPPPQFNHFNGGFGDGGRIRQRRKPWWDIFNPFECESDDEFGDDYVDM